MRTKKEKKSVKVLGIIGIIVFISSLVSIKVLNAYDLFLEYRMELGLFYMLVIFISLFFTIRYTNTLNF